MMIFFDTNIYIYAFCKNLDNQEVCIPMKDHGNQKKYIKNLSLKYGMKLCNKVFYMENSDFGDPSHLFKGAKKNTAI